MKKGFIRIILMSFLVILLTGAGCTANDLQEQPLVIDGVEYPRDAATLDLRESELTFAQYDALKKELPECEIRWSVPFQGGYCDSSTTSLTITSLTEQDMEAVHYFPMLQTVNAEGCGEYALLRQLAEERPDLTVSYSVALSGQEYDSATESLTVADPDVDEICRNLPYLPEVKTVTLQGNLPPLEQLIALKEQMPGITFVWDFEFCGVAVNTLTETVDLSGIPMEDTRELETLLPCFYQLKKVDMCDCGLSNEDMDALNQRYEGTKFVWIVDVCTLPTRTDALYYMPNKYGLSDHLTNDFSNLRYCTDMVVVDLGHHVVNDLHFVEYMPNLQYLQMCAATITDITPLGNCTSLRLLELFLNPITDFWPLTNLTNLEDLNISYTPCLNRYAPRKFGKYGDVTPLLQMTWLDRLWMAGDNVPEEDQQRLLDALPNVVIAFEPGSSTNHGWRYCPNYYTARDIVEMWYMHV